MFRAATWWLAVWVSAVFLSSCSSKGQLAPVDDRSFGATSAPQRVLPGAENAGKPGYYTVKPGDTLIRIGMDQGQSWRDIMRWNKLDNANLIEVGQVLRIAPPQTEVVVGKPIPFSVALPTPLSTPPSTPLTTPATTTTPAPAASASKATPSISGAPAKPAADPTADDALNFQWPVRGSLLAGFDESKNKGLDIAGNAGDPVFAAADGRVVYAGSGLRGYGNLIILKHNNTYLTAYAHNQSLLVKEDQVIKRGQKIAEMGSTDADQVKLHFEIRRQGKPVDPTKYLPAN